MTSFTQKVKNLLQENRERETALQEIKRHYERTNNLPSAQRAQGKLWENQRSIAALENLLD